MVSHTWNGLLKLKPWKGALLWRRIKFESDNCENQPLDFIRPYRSRLKPKYYHSILFNSVKDGYCCSKGSSSDCPVGATNPLQRFDSNEKVRSFRAFNCGKGRPITSSLLWFGHQHNSTNNFFRFVLNMIEAKKILKWQELISKSLKARDISEIKYIEF